MDQPELQKGEGPIGVIVAPTRELAEQIHRETRRFSKPHALQICAAFGGLSKHQQFKELKAGAEVSSGCALLSKMDGILHLARNAFPCILRCLRQGDCRCLSLSSEPVLSRVA